MAQHTHYWSCSRFADWLRGTPKPSAATAEDWDSWHKMSKSAHAVRYWLAEEFLGGAQDFVTWPTRKVRDIKYYINNRWVARTNSLTAHPVDIKPGQWRDVGNRFLPCLFGELVDYVEIELAWWHIAWSGEKSEKYTRPSRFGFKRWRCPQAGIDNLNWQRGLVYDDEWIGADDKRYGQPTPQAIAAQEIYDLYTWWTQTYRNRPDPYDASGWTEICERMRESSGSRWVFTSKDPEIERQRKQASKRLHQMERDYEREDERMMIRLIKVRDSLWT